MKVLSGDNALRTINLPGTRKLAQGEIVLLDAAHRIALTGDIYVNIHGMTAAQSAYNQYAPILMTSVDTDPALCAAERKAVFARLTPGDWQIFGAHGAKKDVSVPDPA